MSNQNVTVNMNWLGLLGIVFIVLKLIGEITWSWWWVLAPFWMPLLLVVIIIAVIAVFHDW